MVVSMIPALATEPLKAFVFSNDSKIDYSSDPLLLESQSSVKAG